MPKLKLEKVNNNCLYLQGMAKVLGMPMAELWLPKRTSTRGNLMNSIQKALHKRYISIISKNHKTKGRFSFDKPFYYTKQSFRKNNKMVPLFYTCGVVLFFLFYLVIKVHVSQLDTLVSLSQIGVI